jgi:Mg2+ and Co2+ transporter CorA
MIEVRKESNSKAIIIFTIVTVVFLPLSFVTSYLGMNSVDIREGTFNQSLFWMIAIPSAAGLIFFLWAVIKFRRRVKRFWMLLLEKVTSPVVNIRARP